MENRYAQRLTAIRKVMKEAGVDFYMIPTADYHNSEYVADYFKAREFVCGFTGSNGTLLISEEHAGLWTDGRYFIQAETQLQGSGAVLFKMAEPGVPSIEEYLLQNMKQGQVLGFDGRCVPMKEGRRLERALQKQGVSVAADRDLVNEIWEDRPAMPCSRVFLLDEERYAGEKTSEKAQRVRTEMEKQGASCCITSKVDEIMWLFNIRGNDVECNPVALSHAMVSGDEMYLFLQDGAVTEELQNKMDSIGAKLCRYEDFGQFLRTYSFTGKVLLNPGTVSYSIFKALGDAEIIETPGVIDHMKAIKNETEIRNIREAYIEDSAALCRFIFWLKKNIGKQKITELSAAKYLDDLRSRISDYVELSFPTISAYGPNAAMMHYEATPENHAVCKPEGMLLVDSGGQYMRGTTDVTRTMSLGPVTEEMIRHYTLTAYAQLQLMDTVFMHGCTGRNLDIMAREPLWREGIDYKCGTGHGIGYLLNVHEGPQNIRWKYTGMEEALMEPGMIVSDEPGVYMEGKYGIRIETILLTVERMSVSDGVFLGFEPLTFVPLDRELLDKTLLSPRIRCVLDAYHAEVFEKVAPYLNEEERTWLKEQTAPIGE